LGGTPIQDSGNGKQDEHRPGDKPGVSQLRLLRHRAFFEIGGMQNIVT